MNFLPVKLLKMVKLFYISVLIVFVFISCSDQQDDTHRKTVADTLNVTFIPNQTIRLYGDKGLITIWGDTNRTRWQAIAYKTVEDAEEATALAILNSKQIQVIDLIDGYRFEAPKDTASDYSFYCDFELFLPRETALTIDHELGNIQIQDITGNCEIAVNVGNVYVDYVAAPVFKLILVVGNLNGRLNSVATPQWDMEISTGNVDLWVPKNISAMITCRATSGTINYTNLNMLLLENQIGRIVGKNYLGEGQILVDVIVGNIMLIGY